jgi:hypothetical protein
LYITSLGPVIRATINCMSAASDNAKRRRATWNAGIAKPADATPLNEAFWKDASVSHKLDALRTMADDVAVMEGHGDSARLQRHLGGVRRARG